MSHTIQQTFDTIAPRYDLLNTLLSWGCDRRWRQQAVSHLKGEEFTHVLDLCAGTLALTIALLKMNPHCQVTAVDFSKEMLEKGWSRLSPDLQKRVKISVEDVLHLSTPKQSFDAAMCAYGFRNVSDNKTLLKKIKNLLRPGGKLVILEFFRPEKFKNKLFNKTYERWVIPFIGGLISGHPQAYRHLRDSIGNYFSLTEFTHLLKECGFKNVRVQPQTGGTSNLITAEVA